MKFIILFLLLVISGGFVFSDVFAYIISDDSTGGDCSTIGTWDLGSKTCTLSGDVDEGIVIGSNNITLDGNDNTLFGPGGISENYGILVEVRTNVILKNLIVDNFYVGIQLRDSFDNVISDNTIQNIEHEGIVLSNYSEDNLISNNLVTGNGGHGIVSNSDNNEIRENTVTQNEIGISSYANSGTILIGNIVTDNQEDGMDISSSDTLIENNIISNNVIINGYGIRAANDQSTNITIKNNEISNNKRGIVIYSDNSKIFQNDIENNSEYGLKTENHASGTEIYQNNFLSNGISASSSASGIFSPSINTGGNYWSDYSPTCIDASNDNFCDAPYPFSGGTINVHDDYVWKIQNGWLTTINTPNDVTLDAQDSSGTIYNYSISATHDGSSISVTCDIVSGSIFPIGVTEVLCTAGNGIKSTFSVTVNPLEPIIHPNSPCDDGCTHEGNNLDLKIFASGYVENPIDGVNTISSIWKDPDGIVVYDEILQVDAQGQFNNEFDNPMYVQDMRDTGTYTTTYEYDDTTLEYDWNYLTSVYTPEPVPTQTEIPSWVKNNAGWWAAGQIDNDSFVQGVEFLINEGILIVNSNDIPNEFPLSLKEDAGSWEDGQISDEQFLEILEDWIEGTLADSTPDSSEISIDASATKTSYENGETILILGSITGYDSAKGLTYIILSPDNNITNIGQISPNSDGSFTKSFDAGGSLWKLKGEYIVKFSYGAASFEVSIDYVGGEQVISDEPEPTPDTDDDVELEIISLSTKKSSYDTGDTIVITGKVNTSDFSKPVTLQVFTGGNLVDIATVSVSLDESFSHTIIAEGPLWKINGKYTVKASYGYDTKDTSFIYRISDSPVPENELDYEVIIVPASGSGAPGCEETSQGCYLPSIASVSLGGVVIMKNTDTAAHTFTSGNPAISDSIQKYFDSGLVMAGSTFEWSPTSEGVVDYFCMVHPWMVGTILVGEGTAPPPTPQPDTSIDLEVSVNDDVYDLNDLVGILVQIDGISGSQKVAIDVTGPSGSTVISRSLTFTSDDEDGEIEFRISEEFKTGTYKVTATTSDDGNTIRDTAYFKVKSQYNSFKITSVETTDQQGNSSDLKAGEIGFIKVELESNKSIATLVTVNIFDYELTSIGIGSVKTTLSSGTSEIILSFMIPADAAIGPSDIYVNAFSDWPSNGGIPLTGEVSSVEEIQ